MRSTALFCLLVLATPLAAQEIEYTYIEGGLRYAEVDDGGADLDGDGFGIAGSLEIGHRWHILVDYQSLDFDFGIDADQTVIGGGYHYPLMPTMDLVANLKYISVDGSGAGFDFDDDGFGASIGLRALVARGVEVEGAIEYQDIDTVGDEFSIVGAVWYEFIPSLAAGAFFESGDDAYGFGFNLRWYFQ